VPSRVVWSGFQNCTVERMVMLAGGKLTDDATGVADKMIRDTISPNPSDARLAVTVPSPTAQVHS
jgi:hypothetical protein